MARVVGVYVVYDVEVEVCKGMVCADARAGGRSRGGF